MRLFTFLIGLTFLFSQQKQDHIITYGGSPKASGLNHKTAFSIGQALIESHSGINNNGAFGFWSFFLMEPQPPVAEASEGDFPDRIELKWEIDVLSPVAANGFKIYRDGNLIGRVDAAQSSFTDFDVIPGQLYTYEISALNKYGEGNPKKIVGFVNPNGVITGAVKTNSNQPVLDAEITISPNLGKSLNFSSKPIYQFKLDSAYKDNSAISLSLWLKHKGVLSAQKLLELSDSSGPKLRVEINNENLEIYGNSLLEKFDMSGMDNEWHNLAIVYSDTSKRFQSYFNGELLSDKVIPGIQPDSINVSLKLGDGHFNGFIDNLSIWSKELSKNEVKQFRNITLSGKEASLAAYYKFDEGQGGKLYDLTKNSFDTKQSGISWSHDIPPVKIGAITDKHGNYIIEGINYGSGTTFTVEANKRTAIGRSVFLNASADSIFANVLNSVDLEKGPYTIERWHKTVNGDWTHYAETFDGSSKNYFINGLSAGSGLAGEIIKFGKDTIFSQETGKTDSILNIYQTFYLSNSFNSFYDEFRIWTKIRSNAEIQSNYNKILTKEDSLKVYFNFNEGSGLSSKNQEAAFILAHLDSQILWSKEIPLDEYFIHTFNPATRTVTLNTSNTATDNVIFTDASLLSLTGFVKFENIECYQGNVEFLVDNKASNPEVKSLKDGSFRFEFAPGESHSIEPVYKDHSFSPLKKQFTNLNQPIAGVLFKNTTKRSLTIEIFGGHEEDKVNIGEFEIELKTKDDCFSKKIITSSLATTITALPAHEYNVFVKPTPANTEYYTTVSFDGQAVSLLDSNNTLKYNYRSKMLVEILDIPKSISGSHYYVKQLDSVHYRVHAFESYNGGANTVDVLKASVNIFDDLSGKSSTVELKNGYGKHYTIPGRPNLLAGSSNPYKKKLEATVTDETGRQGKATLWSYIIGDVSLGEKFTTDFSNMVPITILHKPPGDKSYAFMERGSKYSFRIGSLESTQSGFKYLNNVRQGFKTKFALGIPLTGFQTISDIFTSSAFGSNLSISVTKRTLREVEFTMEVKERFSTANDPKFSNVPVNSDVNSAGDVYVGTSLNFNYGTVISFEFYPDKDSIAIDSAIAIQEDKIKTLFAYSEKNIIESVIPNLVTLGKNSADSSVARYYLGEANKWTNWLIENMISRTSISDKVPFSINLDFRKAFRVYDPSTFIYNLKNIYGNYSDAESGTSSSSKYTPFASNLAKLAFIIVKKPPIKPRIDIAGLIGGTIANFIYSGIVNYNINDLGRFSTVDEIAQEFKGEPKYSDYVNKLNEEKKYRHDNVSFDAGAVIHQEYTSSKSGLRVFNMNFALNTNAKLLGLHFETNVGVYVNIQHAFYSVSNRSTENKESEFRRNEITYGYSLSDDDLGDNFSVNVREDSRYGTPMFELVAGQTSNPWEVHSAARNGVDISIESSDLVNIAPDKAASTKLILGNTSETGEERTYRLKVDHTSNPNGARVVVNGVTIENYLDFKIPASRQIEATVSIYRGPKQYNYKNLQLVFEAPDEVNDQKYIFNYNQQDTSITRKELGHYFRKNVSFNVEYTEPVSGISIFEPGDNWLYTKANNDTIWVSLTDYDTTSQFLKEIQFQYRRHIGSNKNKTLNAANSYGKTLLKSSANPWVTAIIIPKDSLPKGQNFVRFLWDLKAFNDDEYEIRAITISSNTDVPNGSSQILSGVIDTHGPVVMGSPSPVDGVLSPDDEVSLSFNEAIDEAKLSPGRISVINTETGNAVNYSLAKSPRKLVFTFDMNDNRWIENKKLRITIDSIYDVHGNIYLNQLKNNHQINFEFLVDRNPVKWLGGNIRNIKFKDETVRFLRKIKNSGSRQSVTLTNIPDWLNVDSKSFILEKDEERLIAFEFSSSLKFGRYLHRLYVESSFGNEEIQIDFRNLVRPPLWQVKPHDFQYSMNIISELYIDSISSKDSYDKIAVYINGKLSGVAGLEKTYVFTGPKDSVEKYYTYLTVYSNSVNPDTLDFRVWDASEGRILGKVSANHLFSANAIIGSISKAEKLYTSKDLFFQYRFKKGWNWFSLNLNEKDKLSNSLKSIERNVDLIKNHNAFSQYMSGVGFVGSLDSLNTRNTFLIRMREADTLEYIGQPVKPDNHPLALSRGWNAISYLPDKSEDINLVFRSLAKKDGDILKSQTGFAVFNEAANRWYGNLRYMHPGKGYYLKLSEAGSFIYPEPSIQRIKKPREYTGQATFKHWRFDVSNYEHSMSAIVSLDIEKLDVKDVSKVSLAVFDDSGRSRGVVNGELYPSLNRSLFFLTVYSNKTEGEQFTVRVMNTENGIGFELKEKLSFQKNLLIGSFKEPFLIQEIKAGLDKNGNIPREFALSQNYPNPFNPVTRIQYSVKERSKVVIEIYNTLGQKVKTLLSAVKEAGGHFIDWNSRNDLGKKVSSGIYFYRMQAGKFLSGKKMVLIK